MPAAVARAEEETRGGDHRGGEWNLSGVVACLPMCVCVSWVSCVLCLQSVVMPKGEDIYAAFHLHTLLEIHRPFYLLSLHAINYVKIYDTSLFIALVLLYSVT